MTRQRVLSILVLAGEDATWNQVHGGYSRRGHQFNDPADRSVYRHYHRRFRRAWRRACIERHQRRPVWPENTIAQGAAA